MDIILGIMAAFVLTGLLMAAIVAAQYIAIRIETWKRK